MERGPAGQRDERCIDIRRATFRWAPGNKAVWDSKDRYKMNKGLSGLFKELCGCKKRDKVEIQVIRLIGAQGLDRRGPAGSCRLFLGPGFRLAARWNRLVETVKTRKKREKTGRKWARYSLRSVKEGS